MVGLEFKRTKMRSTVTMIGKRLQPVIFGVNNSTQTMFILLFIKRTGNSLADTKLARYQVGLVGNNLHMFTNKLKENREESGC